eukprot:4411035-Alexandrium_andersonii.AAC.1
MDERFVGGLAAVRGLVGGGRPFAHEEEGQAQALIHDCPELCILGRRRAAHCCNRSGGFLPQLPQALVEVLAGGAKQGRRRLGDCTLDPRNPTGQRASKPL